MISINDNNSNFLLEKTFFDDKGCLNFNKNRSDNILPFLVCSQFNKSLLKVSNHNSEISTKNSSSGMNEKKLKLKRRIGINVFNKLNPENIDKIVNNKLKPFEALENLLIIDELYNNNVENQEQKEMKDSISINKTQDNNNRETKKEKKSLSIPKLDFSNIYNKYQRKPLYIQEVNYASYFLGNSEDIDNDSISSEIEKYKKKFNHKCQKKQKGKKYVIKRYNNIV